jgi:hypothetical protein
MRSDDPALDVLAPLASAKMRAALRDLKVRSGMMKEERVEERGATEEGMRGKGAVPAAAGAVARV